jgi:hypothetical protein
VMAAVTTMHAAKVPGQRCWKPPPPAASADVEPITTQLMMSRIRISRCGVRASDRRLATLSGVSYRNFHPATFLWLALELYGADLPALNARGFHAVGDQSVNDCLRAQADEFSVHLLAAVRVGIACDYHWHTRMLLCPPGSAYQYRLGCIIQLRR